MNLVYYVSTGNHIHLRTLSLEEAQRVATERYNDTGVVPAIFEHHIKPQDWTVQS